MDYSWVCSIMNTFVCVTSLSTEFFQFFQVRFVWREGRFHVSLAVSPMLDHAILAATILDLQW